MIQKSYSSSSRVHTAFETIRANKGDCDQEL